MRTAHKNNVNITAASYTQPNPTTQGSFQQVAYMSSDDLFYCFGTDHAKISSLVVVWSKVATLLSFLFLTLITKISITFRTLIVFLKSIYFLHMMTTFKIFQAHNVQGAQFLFFFFSFFKGCFSQHIAIYIKLNDWSTKYNCAVSSAFLVQKEKKQCYY